MAKSDEEVRGPLTGIRIVEIAGIGPVTFTAMSLANLGADVVRVSRPSDAGGTSNTNVDSLGAYRPALVIDLRSDEGRQALFGLCEAADVLLEGMRPGVMERLGVGPDECLARNPRLVYGRVAGYGRDGPMAKVAGHDIDYLAMSGALWLMTDGSRPPVPPMNLVGDYGGGGMMLAFGVVCALVERIRSGRGQVVDTSILQGATHLLNAAYYGRANRDSASDTEDRGNGMMRGETPWYRTYETADHEFIAVGAIEQPFYDLFLNVLGIADELPDRMDPNNWPVIERRLTDTFLSRTRDEWEATFAGTDSCVAPVLSPRDAIAHPHNVASGLFSHATPSPVPEATPRFLRTPGRRLTEADELPLDGLLTRWGLTDAQKKGIAAGEPMRMVRAGSIDAVLRGR